MKQSSSRLSPEQQISRICLWFMPCRGISSS